MPRQAFISHSSADAQVAARICDGLESRNVPCWIAPRDVAFDGTYGTEIMKGLRECEVFLIVLTGSAAESQQVEREAERASHYKKRIIPVIMGRSEPGPRLEFYVAGRQLFPCPPQPDERFLDNLADAIRRGAIAPVVPVVTTAVPAVASPQVKRTPLFIALAAGIVAAMVAIYVMTSSPEAEPGAPPAERPAAPVSQAADPVRTPEAETQVPQTQGRATVVPPPTRGLSLQPANAASAAGARVSVPPDGTNGKPASASMVVKGVRAPFVALPGGTFRMGCTTGDNECEDDEKVVRRVQVDSFQMSATEITQQLWEAVMGDNPSDFKGATLPVEHISWQDSQEFVDRLNAARDGFVYRLPTEAEWEYAARADEPTAPDLNAIAWFGLATGTSRAPRPQNVGTRKPNKWGLYDMLGNVAEWCEDWYSPNYQRVVRGGSWVDSARSVRFSARGKAVPSTRDYSIGLRLVRQSQ